MNEYYAIENKYKENSKVLSNMYNINIIPNPFRSIYAIYYLYDYMATSRLSFESALLHFDLNEIKKKLDKIIEQQTIMILQLSETIQLIGASDVQRDTIIRQNEAIIEHGRNIDVNLKNIETYSEITSKNTQYCAYMAELDHIKKYLS